MKILTQIGLLLLICFVGEIIASLLPFTFPASVISMVLLLLLLLLKVVKLQHIAELAGFLTRNMAIFFIPAGVEILENYKPVASQWLPLLAVLVLTTVLTFAAAAGTVTLCLHWMNRKERRT